MNMKRKLWFFLLVALGFQTACESEKLISDRKTDKKEETGKRQENKEENKENSENQEGNEENRGNEGNEGNEGNGGYDPEEDENRVPCMYGVPDFQHCFDISGQVTDENGEPVSGVLVKNDLAPSCMQTTDSNGEYTYILGFEADPWEEDETPNVTLTFEESGYKTKTVNFEFTDGHRVFNPDIVEEYVRDDADVVLEKR